VKAGGDQTSQGETILRGGGGFWVERIMMEAKEVEHSLADSWGKIIPRGRKGDETS